MGARYSSRREAFKVQGLRELRQALAQLPKAYADDVLLAVMRRRLQSMMDAARGMAPVKSGKLRDSIEMSTKRPRSDKRRKISGKGSVALYMGTNNGIAPFQEYGTVHHAPSPFMRPAWDAGSHDLIKGLADDIWQELEARLKGFENK